MLSKYAPLQFLAKKKQPCQYPCNPNSPVIASCEQHFRNIEKSCIDWCDCLFLFKALVLWKTPGSVSRSSWSIRQLPPVPVTLNGSSVSLLCQHHGQSLAPEAKHGARVSSLWILIYFLRYTYLLQPHNILYNTIASSDCVINMTGSWQLRKKERKGIHNKQREPTSYQRKTSLNAAVSGWRTSDAEHCHGRFKHCKAQSACEHSNCFLIWKQPACGFVQACQGSMAAGGLYKEEPKYVKNDLKCSQAKATYFLKIDAL